MKETDQERRERLRDEVAFSYVQSIRSARESCNYAAPEIMHVHLNRVIERVDRLLKYLDEGSSNVVDRDDASQEDA